jgi:hypothetical protein
MLSKSSVFMMLLVVAAALVGTRQRTGRQVTSIYYSENRWTNHIAKDRC